MLIDAAKVKALVGLARSFPHSPLSEKQYGDVWKIEKKEYNYENIERIKVNENHDSPTLRYIFGMQYKNFKNSIVF